MLGVRIHTQYHIVQYITLSDTLLPPPISRMLKLHSAKDVIDIYIHMYRMAKTHRMP